MGGILTGSPHAEVAFASCVQLMDVAMAAGASIPKTARLLSRGGLVVLPPAYRARADATYIPRPCSLLTTIVNHIAMTISTGSAIRCKYCGRPIAGHGLSDRLTWVGGEPFHYECTLPPASQQPSSPCFEHPYDTRKRPINPYPGSGL